MRVLARISKCIGLEQDEKFSLIFLPDLTILSCAVDKRNFDLAAYSGAVAEWFKATVLKTVVSKGTAGSNPACSGWTSTGKMFLNI